ncbi:FG-GAP repeat domain-containing protein [Streptomyces sp. NPDC092296]|uniref:FG-GAP repeat domain-containing protein n=1 Tax=Streptomyces sp. NPDC092296 TaxID=3366012 RepID=UPI003822C360
MGYFSNPRARTVRGITSVILATGLITSAFTATAQAAGAAGSTGAKTHRCHDTHGRPGDGGRCHAPGRDTTAPVVDGTATFDGVAGDTATLHITGTDPVPAGGGRASGIDHFTYTLSGDPNDLYGGGGTVIPADGTLSFHATTWGTQVIWVQATDRAGNQSRPTMVTFYVVDAPIASTAGDIDGVRDAQGRTHPDLVAVDASGALRLYPTAEQPATPGPAAEPADAPDDTSWTDTLVTHRLSTSGADLDDLWAHTQGSSDLYVYVNQATLHSVDPANGGYYSRARRHAVSRPGCATDCTGYADDWSQVSSMVAPGDVNQDGTPDLFTVENGRLWFFPANFFGGFNAPQLVGATGWGDGDLIAPGDDTGDGTPDLWFRDTASGALLRHPVVYDAATRTVSTSAGTRIGTVDSTGYPLVASVRDVDGAAGAAHSDLWSTGADGNLYSWAGTDTGLGAPVLKGSGGWTAITALA